MESFFIKRKAPIVEDALTACLFDLLRVLDSDDLLRRVLSRARFVDANGRPRGEGLELGKGWDRFEIELWPSWPEGEPDAVVWLLAGKERVGGVVVEAKYGATKSGDYVEGDSELYDQLGRYVRGLRRMLGNGRALGVVYLTPHFTPPSKELSDSWKAITDKTRGTAVRQLSWLGWADVDDALREVLASKFPNDSTESL